MWNNFFRPSLEGYSKKTKTKYYGDVSCFIAVNSTVSISIEVRGFVHSEIVVSISMVSALEIITKSFTAL